MAAGVGFPKWLLDSKDKISRTKEWNSYLGELYDAIQQQLAESHVQAFTDLTDAERVLFLERAARAIHGGEAHKSLYGVASLTLDQHMNNEVAKQLLEDYPINTKTELILDCAQEGAVSLLKKWPDMKNKLHMCLNQPLPPSLRQLVWRLFLENTKVRKRYVDLLNNNPRLAISALDLEISQHCERLLISESSFAELNGSVGVFYAMKATLSYYHSQRKSRERLLDMDYLLVVPFVFLQSSNMSRREPATGAVVALLVEEYLTFMMSRPGFLTDAENEPEDTMKGFTSKVARYLQDKSPETAKAIVEAYLPRPVTAESAGEHDAGNETMLADGVASLVRPLVRALFVGYLNMDVVLFIWDQYMIGLDVSGFHDDLLAALTTIHLILLQDKLRACHSATELESSLKEHSPKLKVQQFQYELNKHFYKDLYATLNQDERSADPVLDPTQAKYPPWSHWQNDKIPNRTMPQDRKLARNEREAERLRQQQQRRDAERRLRQKEEQERREDYEKFMEQTSQENQRREGERLKLEEELEEERQRRLEAEKKATSEIDQLRQQIEELKMQKPKTAASGLSITSAASRYLIPPPPSAATHVSPTQPVNTPGLGEPAHAPSPGMADTTSSPGDSEDAVLAFLNKIGTAFNKIGHGEEPELSQLNSKTRASIRQHAQDLKQAQCDWEARL